MTKSDSRPRVAALVGPYLSGKTSLLEEILRQCDALDRKGSVKDGNMVGDATPEARARQMSTEMNIASIDPSFNASYPDKCVFFCCKCPAYRPSIMPSDLRLIFSISLSN